MLDGSKDFDINRWLENQEIQHEAHDDFLRASRHWLLELLDAESIITTEQTITIQRMNGEVVVADTVKVREAFYVWLKQFEVKSEGIDER